jgi:Protein of unknown function (DUF2585)
MESPAPQAESFIAHTATAVRVNRWPIAVSAFILIVHPIVLRLEGRRWWCACGRPFLWSGNVHSSHNSQHLADPYSFSHIEHGILFYGLFTWLWPRLSVGWRFVLTLAVEAGWEIVENTNAVVDRYRAATISLDYFGDSIGNSIGDVLSCLIGFYLARRIGFWGSLAVVVVTELVMLFWIRDNLLLNIVMLLHPFDAVKQWQGGA